MKTHTVHKSGDNYVIRLDGRATSGPPLATRATALKFARIMDAELRNNIERWKRFKEAVQS